MSGQMDALGRALESRWLRSSTLAAIGLSEVGKALGYRIVTLSQKLDGWAEKRLFDYLSEQASRRERAPTGLEPEAGQEALLDAQHGGRS